MLRDTAAPVTMSIALAHAGRMPLTLRVDGAVIERTMVVLARSWRQPIAAEAVAGMSESGLDY